MVDSCGLTPRLVGKTDASAMYNSKVMHGTVAIDDTIWTFTMRQVLLDERHTM